MTLTKKNYSNRADLLKSACRTPPPQYADFSKSATGQLPTCACRNCPPFADFLKSATGQLLKLPTCACRNSPPLVCRFSKNLPLDSYLSYLHVLAEISPHV